VSLLPAAAKWIRTHRSIPVRHCQRELLPPEDKPERRFRREIIDELAVEAPRPTPAKDSDGQYSQTAGTKRKASPATATWQTDGNGR
jgi:hypothetical protein